MPGTTDDTDFEPGTEGEPEGEPEGTPEGEPEGDPEVKPDKSDKRISDLQSIADKETARANKLAAELKALREGKPAGGNDPTESALMQELREASLDAVYGEFPELKEFGIERALIEGSTRADMRESATSLVGLVKSVATKVENKVLAKHGLKAEPSGETRSKPVDYGSMKDEDFLKLLDSM